MAKPPVPMTKPVYLFPPDFCMVCYHEEHGPYGNACQHNDDAWQDPMVGGDPSNPPRICGCTEYVSRETQGNILVVTEDKKAYAPFAPEQINALRARQRAVNLHPYTCIAHSERSLDPGIDGLACPVPGCGYIQRWCLKVDVDPLSVWSL